jgi:D-glycero-alpha-D-manno-heptose-7-phosphate kinase
MIIIRTPFRISFFGGGTDYPAWYREHGGSVISTTINKYSFLVLRKLPKIFDYNYRVRYYEKQETQEIDDISIPVIREAIKYMNYQQGVDITHHGDLPNRTGIGSSSSFSVSLLHGLSVLKNENITKRQLALEAIHLEQEILGESVGSQDQVAAAFGGFNRINFGGESEFLCTPLPLKKSTLKELESWVQLFFTEQLRNAHDIADKKITNIKNKKINLKDMQDLVIEAESVLFSDNIYRFANLLNDQWMIKKEMEESISNSDIDDIYKKGIKAGAVGGKLLGAGGGGFILFLTPPERHEHVRNALQLKEVPVDFEHLGSQMIYHDYQDQEE